MRVLAYLFCFFGVARYTAFTTVPKEPRLAFESHTGVYGAKEDGDEEDAY